jgi:hypothetical protein
MVGFEQSMKIILRDYTGILTENKDREMIFRFILEGMKFLQSSDACQILSSILV